MKRPFVAALAALVVAAGTVGAQQPCPCQGGAVAKPEQSGWPTFFTKPCGCWTHGNSDFSCGSFKSEMIFIFGGCRSFFGEPCYKGPPGDGSCPPKSNCLRASP